MVDPNYNGNYSGVVVSDNTIIGVDSGFIELGIAMGSQVWSNPHPLSNFGPTTVSNNVFKGNIGFAIVINGWEGGLTVRFHSHSVLLQSMTHSPSQPGKQQRRLPTHQPLNLLRPLHLWKHSKSRLPCLQPSPRLPPRRWRTLNYPTRLHHPLSQRLQLPLPYALLAHFPNIQARLPICFRCERDSGRYQRFACAVARGWKFGRAGYQRQ